MKTVFVNLHKHAKDEDRLFIACTAFRAFCNAWNA